MVTLCIWVWKREVKVLGGGEEMFPHPVLLLVPLFSCPCAGREVISDSCHLPEPSFVFSHLSSSWFWYRKVICTKPVYFLIFFSDLDRKYPAQNCPRMYIGEGREEWSTGWSIQLWSCTQVLGYYLTITRKKLTVRKVVLITLILLIGVCTFGTMWKRCKKTE